MSAQPTLPDGYTLESGLPTVEAYRHLRGSSGLTQVTVAQAEGALKTSWYGCFVKYTPSDGADATIVGMGRIIGGGWYFHIADMAVLPEHQRRGLGDAILKQLIAHIRANAPEGEPFISLMADPPGMKLYSRNGFGDCVKHNEVGMVYEEWTTKPASDAKP